MAPSLALSRAFGPLPLLPSPDTPDAVYVPVGAHLLVLRPATGSYKFVSFPPKSSVSHITLQSPCAPSCCVTSSDESLLAVAAAGTLYLFSLPAVELICSTSLDSSAAVNSLAFSHDNSRVAVLSSGAFVELLSIRPGQGFMRLAYGVYKYRSSSIYFEDSDMDVMHTTGHHVCRIAYDAVGTEVDVEQYIDNPISAEDDEGEVPEDETELERIVHESIGRLVSGFVIERQRGKHDETGTLKDNERKESSKKELITSVAFTSSGLLACGSTLGTVRIFDYRANRHLVEFCIGHPVSAVCTVNDLVFVGSSTGHVIVIDASSGDYPEVYHRQFGTGAILQLASSGSAVAVRQEGTDIAILGLQRSKVTLLGSVSAPQAFTSLFWVDSTLVVDGTAFIVPESPFSALSPVEYEGIVINATFPFALNLASGIQAAIEEDGYLVLRDASSDALGSTVDRRLIGSDVHPLTSVAVDGRGTLFAVGLGPYCLVGELKNFKNVDIMFSDIGDMRSYTLDHEIAAESAVASHGSDILSPMHSTEIADDVNSIKSQLKELLVANEKAPDAEKLEREEFLLDKHYLQSLEQQYIARVEELKQQTRKKALQNDLLYRRLQKQCLDTLETHLHTLQPLFSDKKIQNYPILKRKSNLHGKLKNIIGTNLSTMSYLDVNTRFRRRLSYYHIVEELRGLRIDFNKEFDKVVEKRGVELSKVNERVDRMRDIMAELRKQPAVDYNLGQLGQIVQVMQTQKEPQATHFNFVNKAKPFDMPTSSFVEGEYGTKKVVKNVTDQGQVNQRLEDALVTMMDGQLERPAPSELERVYEASDAQARVVARIMKFYNHIKEGGRISPYDDSKDLVLTEEEIAIFKGYEQAVNKLREEQDKYRRSLEGEFKKLHEEIEGIGTSFLETMSQLEKKRRDVDNTIAKKELIAIQMIRAAQNAKEVAESERDMANQLVTLRRQREITRTRVANLTRKRDFVNHAYEEYMEEERSMDKAAATRLDNLLLKLYKKRGLESFDKPEKVDPVSWANFIEMKQAKLPVEKKVVEAQKLAQWVSMMLQRWLEFDDALARRLDDAEKQYVEFVKDCVFRDAFDVDVLLDVKQGQIEVDQSFIVTDYSQAILIRTDAVNKKNATIADCAKEKISLLHNIKELRRGIYALQWEQERLDLAAQDLSQRIRDVQLLRVTKSMQALVKSSDNKVDPNKGKDKLSSTIQGLMDSGEDKSRYGEQVHAAERTRLERKIEVGRKNAEMKRKERTKQVDGLERQLRRMQDENAVMDDQIRQLEAEAEERRRIYSAQNLGHESEGLQRKMKGVRASRKLQELAKAQQLELLALKQELDRLREKTFPSFAVQRKRQFGNPDER